MLKSSGLSTIEVLVCDDDTVILRIMEHILSELGIGRVQSTSNPKTALQLLKEPVAKPFDIFVCDRKMPEMSGIELLRRVRALGMSTQFVMLTGNATPEAVSEAVELGLMLISQNPSRRSRCNRKSRRSRNAFWPKGNSGVKLAAAETSDQRADDHVPAVDQNEENNFERQRDDDRRQHHHAHGH